MKSLKWKNIWMFGRLLFKRNSVGIQIENSDGTTTTLTPSELADLKNIVGLAVGDVWYVNSANGGSGNPGTTTDRPKATWDQAIDLASADDVIILLPGHDEDIATGGAVDLDVASIATYGIGHGSRQPRITFTAAGSTVEINADNVIVEGVNFEAGAADVTKGIDVKDGADDYRIANNRFTSETTGTHEFADTLFVTTADRGQIIGNHMDMDAGNAASSVHLVGACLGVTIEGNTIMGDYSVANIEQVTSSVQQLVIKGNTLINGVHANLNTLPCIDLQTGTTGYIQDNQLYTNVSAAVTAAVAAAGCFLGGGNFVSTSAETPPIEVEGGVSTIIQSTVATGKADETDNLALFTVAGNVYVHGITQRAEIVANSAVEIGVQINATTTAFDAALVTDTNLSGETAVGDYAVSRTAGGAFTVVAVEDTTTSVMWDTPLLVPPGSIEQAAGGSPGSLVSGYICYWSAATRGATLVAA